MNRISLITQILMVVIAVVIFIMYIQPKVSTIRAVQDVTADYVEETEKVSSVNESLKAKIATIDSIRTDDVAALNRFLPDTIDQISILKDLATIISQSSIDDFDVTYEGPEAQGVAEDGEQPAPDAGLITKHNFKLSFQANYSQLKSMLALLETNDYLLQVSNMNVASSGDGLLKVDALVTTFSRSTMVNEITE